MITGGIGSRNRRARWHLEAEENRGQHVAKTCHAPIGSVPACPETGRSARRAVTPYGQTLRHRMQTPASLSSQQLPVQPSCGASLAGRLDRGCAVANACQPLNLTT